MKSLYAAIMDALDSEQDTDNAASKASQNKSSEAKEAKKKEKKAVDAENDDEEGTEPTAALLEEEKRLIALCKESKAAHKASPKDSNLAQAYAQAKSEYKAFRDAKVSADNARAASKNKQVAGKGGDEEGEGWACEVCNITIAVRADGHAKAQHLAGKAHQKRVLPR